MNTELGSHASPAGYVYTTQRSTVTLAGGLERLFDLFASRVRGYFRHDDCVTVTLDRDRILVECDESVSCLSEHAPTDSDVMELRLEMLTAAHEAWSTAHQAFADLVSVWPEISSRREIPAPPPSDLTLLAQARAIIIADRKATTSYLQRKLKIGYNKAAMIIEHLEREGVISTPDATGKRQVWIDE